MKQNIDTTAEYTAFEPLIAIDKPQPRPDDTLCVSIGNILEAQRTLSPEAFFLYMHFTLSKDKEAFRFFALRFCDRFGFTRNMYLDAYNELVDADYLTTSTQDKRTLFFHDYPLVSPYLFGEYEHDEAEESVDDVW